SSCSARRRRWCTPDRQWTDGSRQRAVKTRSESLHGPLPAAHCRLFLDLSLHQVEVEGCLAFLLLELAGQKRLGLGLLVVGELFDFLLGVVEDDPDGPAADLLGGPALGRGLLGPGGGRLLGGFLGLLSLAFLVLVPRLVFLFGLFLLLVLVALPGLGRLRLAPLVQPAGWPAPAPLRHVSILPGIRFGRSS